MSFDKDVEDFFAQNGVKPEQYKLENTISPSGTPVPYKFTPIVYKDVHTSTIPEVDLETLRDQQILGDVSSTVAGNQDGLITLTNNAKTTRVGAPPIPGIQIGTETNLLKAKGQADATKTLQYENLNGKEKINGLVVESNTFNQEGNNGKNASEEANKALEEQQNDQKKIKEQGNLEKVVDSANNQKETGFVKNVNEQSNKQQEALVKDKKEIIAKVDSKGTLSLSDNTKHGDIQATFTKSPNNHALSGSNLNVAPKQKLSTIHQRLVDHGEETHTVFKDFEDNGLLLLYVPKDTTNLYIAKNYKASDVPGSTRKAIKNDLKVPSGINDAYTKASRENNENVTSAPNNFTKATDKNVCADVQKEDIGKIKLFMQFSQFSLPEVLKYGKKATGQTIEIPGGRRQTQITGVYPIAMSFEVVLVDLFAVDNAAQLELFVGQRAILWFQETGTKLNYKSTSDLGEETHTHAWFGTVMNIEFDYYHRNYIVARITYEPSRDISKLRINEHDNTKAASVANYTTDVSDLIDSIAKMTANNKPTAPFIKLETFRDKVQTKAYPQRILKTAGEDFADSVRRSLYEKDLRTLNRAAWKNGAEPLNTAAQMKSVLEKIAFNSSSFGVFNDALKWLNQNYVQYISQADDFLKNCLNYTKKINNLIPEAISLINTALDPLVNITNTMFDLIKNSAGVLDAAKVPYNFLMSVQNKFQAAKKGYEDTLTYVSTKFTDVYKGVTSYFDKKPEEKKSNISAPELTRLINSMNTYANVPYIPSKYITDIQNTIKNLEKAGVRNMSDLGMTAIQTGLFQDLIIPINVKELAMKNVIAKQEEIKKQKKASLELKYGKKMSDMEAQILFAKELIESTPENNNVSVSVIATNALKDLLKKQNPSPADVKFITEVDIRTTLIRIMAGTKPNPAIAMSATNISNQMSAVWKTLPTPVIVNKAYMITEQDITLGYNGIAGKFYFNPLLGARLEKYNNMKKLELGISIIIPTNYILERFDYVPEKFDGTKIRFAISYIITSADVIGGYALIAANFYSDPLLGIRLQKYNSMKVLVEGDLITIPPLSILKTFDLIS